MSTSSQDTQRQQDALDPICVKVFAEKISGAKPASDRAQLQAAIDYMRPGDMLVVQEIDRLGRNLVDALLVLAYLFDEREVAVKVLDGIAAGEHTEQSLLMDIALAIAADRRRDIVRKTKDGLAAARARGRVGGRPSVVDDDKRRIIVARHEDGESIRTIAAAVGVSIGTVANTLKARRAVIESAVVDQLEETGTDLDTADEAPGAPRRSRRSVSADEQELPRSRRTVVDGDDDEDLGPTRARPARLDEKRASGRTRRAVEDDDGSTPKTDQDKDARRRRARDERNAREVAERQEAAEKQRRQEQFAIESKERGVRARGHERDAARPPATEISQMKASAHLARLRGDDRS